jgi:multidrug resistance efflux pump
MAGDADNDREVLTHRVEQAGAEEKIAIAGIAKAIAERDHAVKDMARADQLLPQHAIAQSDFDEFDCRLKVALAAVDEAQAKLELANAKRAEAERVLAMLPP